MTLPRIAIVFDNRSRPETTGTHCRRAFGALAHEGRLHVDHFLPNEVHLVPPEAYHLYLYVDDGLTRSFSERHGPIAWWAIDTHLAGAEYLDLARSADHVFTAQRNGAEWFQSRGIEAVWLPLAADPDVHERLDVETEFDVSFVGHVHPGPRAGLLARLQREFPGHFVGRAYFEEMARVYSASRVVFNRSIRDDVNMRVFEAVACGSLLVTNALVENGQDDLLRDGEHLVTYRDEEELVDKVRWYLAHGDVRERIAAAGRAEVLARHTYRHRMERILESVSGRSSAASQPVDGTAKSSAYFGFARPEVVELVPRSARRVLDVGCGSGRLGAAVKVRQAAEVTGVEADREAAEAARRRLDRVIHGDVETERAEFEPASFDCIVCADVLEHLRLPDAVLGRIRRWLTPDGVLVASLPNVRHHTVVRSLLAGNWTYESAGLLDDTHLRFFTRREIEKLLFRAGFEIADRRVVPGPGHEEWLASGAGREVSVGGLAFRGRDAADAEEFFAYQFLVVAKPVERPADGLTSIVIPTHGQRHLTEACLDSIRRHTDEPYELVVVDNASPDDTVAWLRTQSDVRLIANVENRGFPAAVNQGIAAATGDHVLLLNNDTVVTTGWLRRMLDALHSDERIGLVGPVSNNVSGPQQVEVAYDQVAELDGFAWDWGRDHERAVEDLDRLVGFCLLIDRPVLDAIGSFDERFGLGNFEDDDFCRRAREAGFRTVVARDAFVHHVGSATFRATGVEFGDLLAENEQRYREKWAEESEASPADDVLLSLCMIVRDNERTIRPALESVKPWVDEMVVVDTGSTDRTPDICRELGARVFEFPWCDDFSAARNESFRHAQGEWLFWMDSDDTIDEANGRGLRELATGPHDENALGYVVRVHCPGDTPHDVTAVDHVKLVRNRPDLRFEHRIHEQLLPAIRRAGGEVRFTDLFVVHSGSDKSEEGRAGKIERDLRILAKDLEDRPDHPFVLFNLGMTYADVDRHDEAVEYLRRSIVVSGPEESHVRKAFALLVGTLVSANRHDEAWDACCEGLARFPDDPELLFRSGLLHHHFGRLRDAEACYQTVLAGGAERRFASVDVGIVGFKTRHNLALVYEEMGRLDDAERQWQAVTEERPDYRAGWRGLGNVLLERGDLDAAEAVAERMSARRELTGEAHVLRARGLETRGDSAAAIDLLRNSLEMVNGDPTPLRELCRLTFEHAHWNDAERHLNTLVDLAPDDAAAWHNLGTVLQRGGRHEDAARAFERSLKLRPGYEPTLAHLGSVRRNLAQLLSQEDGVCHH